jgi:VanZ family protein
MTFLAYHAPLLLWLVLIYHFSTDAYSISQTSQFILPFLRFFLPGAGEDELAVWHVVIRKLGHVTEYFILCLLTYRALKYTGAEPNRIPVLSFAMVLLIALVDELHQALTMSRGASLTDVSYDSIGGLVALWLIRRLNVGVFDSSIPTSRHEDGQTRRALTEERNF